VEKSKACCCVLFAAGGEEEDVAFAAARRSAASLRSLSTAAEAYLAALARSKTPAVVRSLSERAKATPARYAAAEAAFPASPDEGEAAEAAETRTASTAAVASRASLPASASILSRSRSVLLAASGPAPPAAADVDAFFVYSARCARTWAARASIAAEADATAEAKAAAEGDEDGGEAVSPLRRSVAPATAVSRGRSCSIRSWGWVRCVKETSKGERESRSLLLSSSIKKRIRW